jgi:hypothetical protein
MPAWMMIAEPEQTDTPRPFVRQPLGAYGERALDGAVKAIVGAPAGEQRDTLNRECFAIAGLCAGGVIGSPLALESLRWAAGQMPSHDRARPWSTRDLDKAVHDAFIAGLRCPRQPKTRPA